MDEDRFLKRLLTLYLIDIMVLPVIMRYLMLLGILFMVGVVSITKVYNYHHSNGIIETYNKENFLKVMLVEVTKFTDQKIPDHRHVMSFEGSDSSVKAKQWLKDNKYWDEKNNHTWNLHPTNLDSLDKFADGGFDRDDFVQFFPNNKIIEDKDYPPNHIVNNSPINKRKVEYILVFQDSKDKRYVMVNGALSTEDRTGYKEYIDLFLNRTTEELEKTYAEIEVQ